MFELRKLFAKNCLIIITTFVFFRQFFFEDLIILILISFISFYFFIPQVRKLKFSPLLIPIVIFLISMMLSIIPSFSKNNSIKFFCVMSILFLLGVGMSGKSIDLFCSLKHMMKFAAFFHMLFSYFTIFFPHLSITICGFFLPAESVKLTQRWLFEMHRIAGISGQLGTNAVYMSILICIYFVEYLLYKEKKDFLFLFLAIIMLLMTGKKGIILAVAVAISVIIILFYFNRIWVGLSLSIIACIVSITGVIFFLSLNLQTKIYHNFYVSIISRAVLYEKLFSRINDNIFFGNGVDTTVSLIGHQGHNIYLQILYEQGIIGLIFFVFAIVIPMIILIRYLKIHKKEIHKKNMEIFFMSIFFQVFFIIYGLTDNPLYDYQVLLVYFVLYCGAYNNLGHQMFTEKKNALIL